jgi:hypothetical protein
MAELKKECMKMGWTGTHYDGYIRTAKDKKTAMDEIYNGYKDWGKVLKSSIVNNVYYAAIHHYKTNSVFATVVLLSIDNSDYFNLNYKDMSEDMGPCYYDCPITILNLLTKTESDYAKEWRKKCREHIAKKKNTPKVKEGCVIEFTNEIEMTDENKIKKFTLVKYNNRFVFRAENGKLYRISNWKKREYKIIA